LTGQQQDEIGVVRREAGANSEKAEAEAPAPSSSSVGTSVDSEQKIAFQGQEDAPACSDCGSIMIRNGTCYKCLNCGGTSGCS